ncbi:hypothetical protein QNH20_16470 [Neobacillus sp. WH10]|uniref:hypothetical protein n=1 Tax=Neobacillus sp. WH10 TaxID=3047873 RepID=UPI0024C10395|nr:hypothetical protein [Neobacillus sp. WH10]WHY75713.1 hypothetical protein QNH20_16470 [Neobacillus sp. WH10]
MFNNLSLNPLNNLSTLEILSRLERYKKVDLKRITHKDLFDLTLETLPCLMVMHRNIGEGTKLYRLRGKDPGTRFSNISDVWYRKAKFVKSRQRLNDVGEAMLYTSLDQATPFYEVKASEGQSFAHIEYEVKNGEYIQASSIGMNDNAPDFADERGLNEQGKINQKILEQFLHTEFTKEVGIGTEYLYRISIMLAKNFYDIPNCDGYIYPSVAFKNGLNLAVKPTAADNKLKLKKVENLIVKKIFEDGRVEFQRESVSSLIDPEGNIYY